MKKMLLLYVCLVVLFVFLVFYTKTNTYCFTYFDSTAPFITEFSIESSSNQEEMTEKLNSFWYRESYEVLVNHECEIDKQYIYDKIMNIYMYINWLEILVVPGYDEMFVSSKS